MNHNDLEQDLCYIFWYKFILIPHKRTVNRLSDCKNGTSYSLSIRIRALRCGLFSGVIIHIIPMEEMNQIFKTKLKCGKTIAIQLSSMIWKDNISNKTQSLYFKSSVTYYGSKVWTPNKIISATEMMIGDDVARETI